MNPDTFRQQVAAITARLAGRPLDTALDAWLNAECGPCSATYRELEASCRALVLYLLPQGRIDFTRE